MDTYSDYSLCEDDMSILIRKLRKIFEHYCQFGERLNTVYMKSNKYMKLAQESEIIDQVVNRTRLELIYKSETKSNQMDFQKFLNSLIKIGEWKYIKSKSISIDESENKQKALSVLIENHFIPLFDKLFGNSLPTRGTIMDQSNYENRSEMNLNQSNLINVPIIEDVIQDPNIEEIFMYVSPVLYEIYRVYFPHEISISENFEFVKDNSVKQYLKFMRDFELCPNFITKSAAFSIYQSEEEEESINANNKYYMKLIKNVDLNSIIRFNNKNNNILGQHFNFFKFLRSLLKIAEYGYEKFENGLCETRNNLRKTNSTIIPNYERLILILEKMEMSEGFLSLERKTNKTHSLKSATIIGKSLLEKLQKHNKQAGNNSIIFDAKENSMILFGPRNLEEKKQNLLYNNNYLEICELSSYIEKTYGDQLLHIFQAFCSFGDAMNTKYLRTRMFTKLLMEAHLIHISTGNSDEIKTNTKKKEIGLKFNDIDTIFIKLASLPSNNTETISNTIEKFSTSPMSKTSLHNNSNLSFNNPNPLQADISPNFSFYNSNNKKKTPINSYAKIDFDTFIISIEVIARLLLPDASPKDAVEYIINEHLLHYLTDYVNKTKQSYDKIDNLRKKLSDNDTVLTLQLAHKALLPVFKAYSDKNGWMNYDQFMRYILSIDKIIFKYKF
jgi:hypothetical protein